MYLAAFEIAYGTYLVGIVGVLIGQQSHILAYSVRAFIPESDRPSVVGFVVIQSVLQGEVLQIDVVARQQECGGVVDRFVDRIGCVFDNYALHRLPYQADIVCRYLCQYGLAEVVHAIG